MKNRINTLKNSLEKKKLDAYIVANETNILYFTGFLGAFRLLVPREGENVLYVPGVNYEDAKEEARNCRVELLKSTRGREKIANHVESLKGKRVGFDSLEASSYLRLVRALKGIELEAQSELVWELRKVKDETELAHMRRAAELTSEGVKAALQIIKPALREYEVAAEIEYAMRKLGSGGVAFDTIVASGPRSAFPHAGCTDRTIRKGDLVLLDIGAKYQHYRADLTRTVSVGKPSSKQMEIHEIVREAQNRAFHIVKAGVNAFDLDGVARGLIKKKGYGDYFVHRLGHGIGLDIHEPPILSSETNEKLGVGNVVTVEPGIYIPDFGGVRIEDTVLVEQDGAQRLTEASYVLRVG